MLKRMIIAALFFMPMAANAQGFVAGLGTGLMLGGGGDVFASGSATVLYTAAADTLKIVNVLDARHIAKEVCFGSGYDSLRNRSLNELFAELTKERGQKERTLLQVVRVNHPTRLECAGMWFTYIEK